ncbi:GNAT family N-acetyltransferase [Neptunomonas qingdaonensis]|nr:GNAT family N-acetyltransferase [Neptunomonas qingdaonensis]
MSKMDSSSITFKIAQSQEELESAFKLVWQAYVATGLQHNSGEGIRFTKYHLLPTTRVLIAIYHPELDKEKPDYTKLHEQSIVVGTLSIIEDSPLGLPMEEICGNNVMQLRKDGHKLVEIVGLAINPDYRKYNIAMYLYKLMFQFVRHKDITDVACSVTKKHLSFYRRMLLFKTLGEIKEYSAANKLETQCHILNIKEAETTAEAVYNADNFDANLFTFFFTDTPEANRLKGEGTPLSEELLTYFLNKDTLDLDDATKLILRDEYKKIASVFPF